MDVLFGVSELLLSKYYDREEVVVREVSSTREITFYCSTKWIKDRPTPPILASSGRKNKKKWDPKGKSWVQMATQNI